MKNAAYYAQESAHLTRIMLDIKPLPRDRRGGAKNLAIFYLNSASKLLREEAEYLAEEDKRAAENTQSAGGGA
jgi:hypothetical protein